MPINLFTGQQNYTPEERKQQRIQEYQSSIQELQELSQKRQEELNHARSIIDSHTTEVQLLATSIASLQALLKAEEEQ